MRYFLSKSNKTLFILLLFTSFCIYSNAQVQQDLYGRPIKSSTGEKINYSQSDLNLVSNSLKTATSQIKTATSFASKCFKDTINAKYSNLYSIMGNCIGRNSMHSLDIDNDGAVELICTATTQTFGSASYWYIIRYNSTNNTYSQVWTSMSYETNITTLEVVDYNNDGKYEILIGFSDGTLLIYDAATRDLVKKIAPVTEQINSIVYADADNDGQKDIVISCASNTYILDSKTLTQKFKINKGAN